MTITPISVPVPPVRQETMEEFKSWVADLMFEEGCCTECRLAGEGVDVDNTREYVICQYHHAMRISLAGF